MKEIDQMSTTHWLMLIVVFIPSFVLLIWKIVDWFTDRYGPMSEWRAWLKDNDVDPLDYDEGDHCD